jgi:hypothetical protein
MRINRFSTLARRWFSYPTTCGITGCVRARGVIPLLFSGVLLGVFAGTALASPTDSQGYIENWPGNVVLQFNSNPDADFLQAVSASIPPISSQLKTAFSSQLLCSKIQAAVTGQLGSRLSKWDACSVGPNPELRGKMLASNMLGLKVIFSDISFSFDVSGALGDNPTIDVTADAELDVVVGFANSIDGFVTQASDPVTYNTLPANVQSAPLSFSNANITTHNVVASILNSLSGALGGPTLGQLSALINQQSLSQTSLLNQTVDQLNPQLHNEASILGGWIRTVGLNGALPDPNANDFFLLAVSIDSTQNLVIDFERNGTAPLTPTGCFASSLSYASVEVMCYTYSDGSVTYDGTDQMLLQRDPPAWPVVDNGVSNPWDVPVPPIPRLSAPFFQDSSFQEQPTPPKTATYRVCAYNLWGAPCGVPMTVALDLTVQPVSSIGPPSCGPNSKPYRMCIPFALPPQQGLQQGISKAPVQK